MKIAIFHNLPPGGAKRVLFEEVKALSKNHELHLFEFELDYGDFLDPKPLVSKVFRFNFEIESNLPSFLARLEKDYKNFISLSLIHKKIAQKINGGGYDVALIHPDVYTETPWILKYLAVPNVYYSHELLRIVYLKELEFDERVIFAKRWYENLTRRVRKIVDRNNARAADKILTNSRYMQGKIEKVYKRKSTVCYPGVDPDIFKPVAGRAKKLLFIGNKEKVRGYFLIKKTLEKIDSKFRPNLKVLDFVNGRPKILDDKQLAKEYAGCLATICADYDEAFGLKAIESMACGTPVLAVNEGGYRETVIDGKTGFLLRREPKVFAERIVYLIKHPEVVKKMGKVGRKHVIENFSWRKHLDCLEKELEKLQKKNEN